MHVVSKPTISLKLPFSGSLRYRRQGARGRESEAKIREEEGDIIVIMVLL